MLNRIKNFFTGAKRAAADEKVIKGLLNSLLHKQSRINKYRDLARKGRAKINTLTKSLMGSILAGIAGTGGAYYYGSHKRR